MRKTDSIELLVRELRDFGYQISLRGNIVNLFYPKAIRQRLFDQPIYAYSLVDEAKSKKNEIREFLKKEQEAQDA